MQQPEGQRTSDQHKLHMEALQSLTSSYKTRLTSTLTLRDNYVLLCFFRDETVTLTHQPANEFFFFQTVKLNIFFCCDCIFVCGQWWRRVRALWIRNWWLIDEVENSFQVKVKLSIFRAPTIIMYTLIISIILSLLLLVVEIILKVLSCLSLLWYVFQFYNYRYYYFNIYNNYVSLSPLPGYCMDWRNIRYHHWYHYSNKITYRYHHYQIFLNILNIYLWIFIISIITTT